MYLYRDGERYRYKYIDRVYICRFRCRYIDKVREDPFISQDRRKRLGIHLLQYLVMSTRGRC